MFSLKDRKEPFIIAEMSGNHNHSLERALKIVDAAADAGVDALKLQTYTADTMTLDIDEGEFHIGDPRSLWAGESLYSLYQKAYTPWEWHKPIFDRCKVAYKTLGTISYETDKAGRVGSRSLYIAKDMKAGDVIDGENVRDIRPGLGLSPKYYDIVMGRKVNRDVKRGTPLSWDLIG